MTLLSLNEYIRRAAAAIACLKRRARAMGLEGIVSTGRDRAYFSERVGTG